MNQDQQTPTLFELIEQYVETRHTCGAYEYNEKTAEARKAVLRSLESLSNTFRPTNMQVLAITTAYEQGVGKGHRAVKSGDEIKNPYSPGWNCDHAWKIGYEVGKDQQKMIDKDKTFTIPLDTATKVQMAFILMESGTDTQKAESLKFLRSIFEKPI